MPLLLCLFVGSCQNGNTYDDAQRKAVDLSKLETQQVNRPLIQQYKDGDIRFFDDSDMVIGNIEGINRIPSVETGDIRLESKAKGDVRTYSHKGSSRYRVVYENNAFSLTDAGKNFLYKITVSGNRIRIANDKEVSNYYEISAQKDSQAKIMYRNSVLGNMYFMDEGHFISAFNKRYTNEDTQYHASYSIIGLSKIPLEQRLIMITELIQMGY